MKEWKDESYKGRKEKRMKGVERMKALKEEKKKAWKDESFKGRKEERMKGWKL